MISPPDSSIWAWGEEIPYTRIDSIWMMVDGEETIMVLGPDTEYFPTEMYDPDLFIFRPEVFGPYPPGSDNDPHNSPAIEKLTDRDIPRFPGIVHRGGNVGDIVEWRLQFRQYVRLLLGDTWYRASEPFFWRFHVKLEKKPEAIFGHDLDGDGLLQSDVWAPISGSVTDKTNDGWE